MKRLFICAAVATVMGSVAFAAAPTDIETTAPMPGTAPSIPAGIYELDKEMVVQDWVLCVSQTVAEDLVHAREEGVDQARSAYEAYKETRQCGQFAELRVILQEPLYKSTAGDDARAFGALVNLTDNWASAFVVTGALPEEEPSR